MSDNYIYDALVIKPPPTVGSMEILPEIEFHLTKKPNWFHRLMMRLLLGWKWKDNIKVVSDEH